MPPEPARDQLDKQPIFKGRQANNESYQYLILHARLELLARGDIMGVVSNNRQIKASDNENKTISNKKIIENTMFIVNKTIIFSSQ